MGSLKEIFAGQKKQHLLCGPAWKNGAEAFHPGGKNRIKAAKTGIKSPRKRFPGGFPAKGYKKDIFAIFADDFEPA